LLHDGSLTPTPLICPAVFQIPHPPVRRFSTW
jgi:hypothetical protein